MLEDANIRIRPVSTTGRAGFNNSHYNQITQAIFKISNRHMISIPKPTKIRSKKIRDSARGESCTLRISGVCNHNSETTVLAHLEGNKGTGTKNDDLFAVYACSSCHDWLDGRKTNQGIGYRSMGAYMAKLRALQETQKRLIEKGIIEVK